MVDADKVGDDRCARASRPVHLQKTQFGKDNAKELRRQHSGGEMADRALLFVVLRRRILRIGLCSVRVAASPATAAATRRCVRGVLAVKCDRATGMTRQKNVEEKELVQQQNHGNGPGARRLEDVYDEPHAAE